MRFKIIGGVDSSTFPKIGPFPKILSRHIPAQPSISEAVLFFRVSVRSSFNLAMLGVTENLQVEESDTDPDDERFASADLLAVSLLGDTATMSVKVTSQAGTSFTALLPLNITTY